MSGTALSSYSNGGSGLQANTFADISPQVSYTNNNDTTSNMPSYPDTSNIDTPAINAENSTNTQESITPSYPDSESDSSSLRNSNSVTTKAKPSGQGFPITTDGKKEESDKDKESGCKMLVKEERIQPPPHMLEPPAANPTVTKRRRTVLSIAEKADLIRRLHNGESQRQLALEYGIGTSTVSDVKKHEAEILEYVETNGDFVAMTRRKLESGAKADVEEAVFGWLLKEVRRGEEVTGAEVMARARHEHQTLRGTDEFRASTGWLERFKRRYNIRSFKPGEEDNWRPIISRVTSIEASKAARGRRRGRPPLTRLADKARQAGQRDTKVATLEFLEQVLDGSSPTSVKSEVENPEESEYPELKPADDLFPDTQTTLQPLVSLEEGHMALDLPPVQEIPSAVEAASLLSKALVWAAAQPDTTPQELFVMKQLQTKAALRSIVKASH
ncbi:uncharacterized protein [Panulirus ornatus]|uniref:uncharacterized protein n=1 Tax=Panulirus ornatus TaxID=150431 RepID=UPI003A86E545